MAIGKVTVIGAGVLGTQIAFQAARHGFEVIAYDIDDAAIARSHKFLSWVVNGHLRHVPGTTEAQLHAAQEWLSFSTDLAAAVREADLVIEAVPEQIELKLQVYTQLRRLAPAEAIFASNSSTLLPSAMAEATGRPKRFLALHFANEIWRNNIAEIMGHAGTDPDVLATVVAFARDIGMVPIFVQKEKAGYVLNSLLVPLLSAAGELLVDGVADPESIDRTWKIATGAPRGPCQIFDIIGLSTVYNVSVAGNAKSQQFARYLMENYIEHGKLGVLSGEGFYRYGKLSGI